MIVHLIDGTYELFRQFFARPSHRTADGQEVAAARAVVGGLLRLLEEGATHLGMATDHVIPSFRNELYEGYKSGEETPPELFEQFSIVEKLAWEGGFCVWPMIEYEADDALATAAARAAEDPDVEKVMICTPDKDLAQCVTSDGRVVQFDLRKGRIFDRSGVIDRFGVPPESIPDYLALVGDTADGFPGLPGWGAKSAAAVLARYGSIENIPTAPGRWDAPVRAAPKLSRSLEEGREEAALYLRLATLVRDVEGVLDDPEGVDALKWRGPRPNFAEICARYDAERLVDRASALTPKNS